MENELYTLNFQDVEINKFRNELTLYKGNAQSITIPPKIGDIEISEIGALAFKKKDLIRVIIPASINTVGTNAFESNKITELTISNGVETIGEWAFQKNEIAELEIPESVKKIEAAAFQCNKLTYITIPGSVKTIDENAFYKNILEKVIILNGVKTIKKWAFCDNKITELVIPDSVTTIEKEAFKNNQLTTVIIPVHTTIEENAFDTDVEIVRSTQIESIEEVGVASLNQIINTYIEEITKEPNIEEDDVLPNWEYIHYCMHRYNWDWGMEFPKTLIDHPDCDKATALLIFWYAAPAYYLRNPKEKLDKQELEHFAFLQKIAAKYVNGGFKTKKIKFDPQNDAGTNWTSDVMKTTNNSGWEIPDEMLKATEGNPIGYTDIEDE